jgi:hypothetical protein
MRPTLLQSGSRASLLVAGIAMSLIHIGPAQADPSRVVLPSGTVIPVLLNESLSSKTNQPGDRFTATVKYGRDDAGLPEGTRVEGVVREALPHEGDKPGVLDVDFSRMVLPNGDSLPITGSLYSLDGKAVKHSDNRLVATSDKSKDRLKWVGIGAGAGLIISTLTKGNTLVDTLLGAGAGYLYNELSNKRPSDVNLKQGSEFGVRLDRQVAFNADDRSYYRGSSGRPTSSDRSSNQNDRYYRDSGSAAPSNREDNWRRDSNGASDNIGVMIDDREVRFDRSARPYRHGSVVFVPLTPVARAANVDYRYDPANKMVYANNNSVRLALGSRIAIVNGERRRLPAAAEIHNGTLYVPMQFIGWITGGSVSWDDGSQTVVVTTNR